MILLEEPRHLGNLGACVRVAAAAGAAGVITTGTSDPWHADALRGSAGLHFALPVARSRVIRTGDRPLIALDPEGEPLRRGACRSARSWPSAPSATASPTSCWPAPTLRLALPMSPGRLEPEPRDRGLGVLFALIVD